MTYWNSLDTVRVVHKGKSVALNAYIYNAYIYIKNIKAKRLKTTRISKWVEKKMINNIN